MLTRPAGHRAARRSPRSARRVLWLVGSVGLLVLVAAGPAVAVVDGTAPSAQVTAAPSCGPGVVRVQVDGGSVDTTVTLVSDRALDGEAVADLPAGGSVELDSAEVAPGETVQVTLRVQPADGSDATERDLGSWTRPTSEDCAAASSPPAPVSEQPPADADPPTGSPGPTDPTPTDPGPADPGPADPAPHTPDPSSDPAPSSGGGSTGGAPESTSTAGASAGMPDEASAGSADIGTDAVTTVVESGGLVTVRSSGFTAGEQVVVSLVGGAPLATLIAEPDGSVEAEVRLPAEVPAGVTQVQLVGNDSAARSEVGLMVTAQEGDRAPWPLAVGGVALLACALCLAVLANRPGNRLVPRRRG